MSQHKMPETDELVYSLIIRAMECNRMQDFLKWSYLVAGVCNDEIKEQLKLSKKRDDIKEWMQDLELDRELNLRYSITESPDAFHYFDDDKGEDDPYMYMEKLEKDIKEIQLYILDMFAGILKLLNIDNID